MTEPLLLTAARVSTFLQGLDAAGEIRRGRDRARAPGAARDREMDEALGLNTAWYADILLTLTED